MFSLVCLWVCHLHPPYLHLAASEMLYRGVLTELSLCCSIVYHYNGAQLYEQFLQVGRILDFDLPRFGSLSS